MEHSDEQPASDEEWQEYLADRASDYADEYPDLDDPPRRLHFDELHPLIREAAGERWDRGDYAGAVDTAWTALRDEIQRRTRRADLDGVDLINAAIGETEPKLPLTEHVSDTDKNMHRGLVNFLRGIVFYVRNPEKHETISPVEGDREGAFERLAVMSLCARHVATAAAPTAIEDAIKELTQPKFPNRRAAFDNLLQRVPARRHSELLAAIIEATLAASADHDDTVYRTLTTMYRHTVERSPDPSLPAASAVELDLLVANDATLNVGIRLLTPKVNAMLEERNQWKVHDAIVHAINHEVLTLEAVADEPLFSDVIRLVPGMRGAARQEVLTALDQALLEETPSRRAWAYFILLQVGDFLTPDERAPFVSRAAGIAMREPQGLVAITLQEQNAAAPLLRSEIAAALAAHTTLRETAAESVAAALLEPPDETPA